jgi:hypothetical protein
MLRCTPKCQFGRKKERKRGIPTPSPQHQDPTNSEQTPLPDRDNQISPKDDVMSDTHIPAFQKCTKPCTVNDLERPVAVVAPEASLVVHNPIRPQLVHQVHRLVALPALGLYHRERHHGDDHSTLLASRTIKDDTSPTCPPAQLPHQFPSPCRIRAPNGANAQRGGNHIPSASVCCQATSLGGPITETPHMTRTTVA